MNCYLVSYSIPRLGLIGHANLDIKEWKNGNHTEEVMKFIADKQVKCDYKDIIITSVFKLS